MWPFVVLFSIYVDGGLFDTLCRDRVKVQNDAPLLPMNPFIVSHVVMPEMSATFRWRKAL